MIIKQLNYQINDLNCDVCSAKLLAAFKKYNHIKVKIDQANHLLNIKYNPLQNNKHQIKQVINDAGMCLDLKEQQHQTDNHTTHLQAHAEHFKVAHSPWKQNWVSLSLMILGIVVSIPLALALIPSDNLNALRNPYLQLALAIVGTYIVGGQFLWGMLKELFKNHRPGMYTLTSTGALIAFWYSVALLIIGDFDHLVFEVAAVTITIVRIGDWLTDMLKTKAKSGLTDLFLLQPQTAIKIVGKNKYETVSRTVIKANDRLLVPQGANVPLDGSLISTQAAIDEALLTGESLPVTKKTGAQIYQGTVNVGPPLIMKATTTNKKTVLDQIIAAVETVSQQQPHLQTIANKISMIFTPVILSLGIIVFLLWYFIGVNVVHIAPADQLRYAIEAGIGTIITACPCAFGIATPLAIMAGLNKAAKAGVIYQNINVFEKIKDLDLICFDKTGTLTTGQLQVNAFAGNNQYWPVLAALEAVSIHPIAKAITAKAETMMKTNLQSLAIDVQDINETAGQGLTATDLQHNTYQVMGLQAALNQNYQLAPTLTWTAQITATTIALVINQTIVFIVSLTDQLRPAVKSTLAQFKTNHWQLALVSGDEPSKVKTFAHDLGLKAAFGGVSPQEKAAIIKSYQQQGLKVAYVGDGINDAIALKQADLAISFNTATALARNTSDLILTTPGIDSLLAALKLTKATRNMIKFNFIWALGYNVAAVPLAALHIIVPLIGAIIMAGSDFSLAANSLAFSLWNPKRSKLKPKRTKKSL